MKQLFLSGILGLFLFSCSSNFQLKTGDLLFQDLDCGSFCDAIEKVTQGVDGYSFSHVGIVLAENGKTWVLEAGGRGVVKTPLDSFMNRSKDVAGHAKVVAGRIKKPYRYVIPQAILKAENLLGKPYDDYFDISNDRYYCSELAYYAFRDSAGKPLFELNPMTFTDPDTRKTFPAWERYFEDLHVPIPEGKPGLNPGGISRSPVVEIVKKYY